MKNFEIAIDDEIFDKLFIKTLKDQLEYSVECYDKANSGKLAGVYSWDDIQKEKTELLQDISAYMRILKLYGE